MRRITAGWKQTGRSYINRVLHDDWNPIGVEMPDDEYSIYAETVGRMLHEERSVSEILSYLGSARDYMGLERAPEDDAADERVATSLVTWFASAHRDRDCAEAETQAGRRRLRRRSGRAPCSPRASPDVPSFDEGGSAPESVGWTREDVVMEPTPEQMEKAVTALVPYVQEWSLPLNPEELCELAGAVLTHFDSDAGLDAIEAAERERIKTGPEQS